MTESEILGPTARWVVGERNELAERALAQEIGVPAVLAALLVQRGYSDADAALAYLNPRVDGLHDPRLLPDYELAVAAILGARERGELIFVHGDYDVDGVTSAAIFSRFLNIIGCKVHTHVPHRMKEGYGIHGSAVLAAKELGAKLFLTCDCGIGAHEQIAEAREAGMTVVVTDHHHVGPEMPNAHAIVNPHRPDSQYPFQELSGAGVVFKLCAGITQELGHNAEGYYRAFFDLAALGTIADVMPLVGENRIIARHGLERLSETKKVGLQALMREAKLDPTQGKPLKAFNVSFGLGPRLNAAGRVDDAALALRLLLTSDDHEAGELAHQIEQVNDARRKEQQRIVDEAVEMVVAKDLAAKGVIVVGSEGWHAGLVGIVAGRLVEQFSRPAFVLAFDPNTRIYKGSARSIAKFHLAEAIHAHSDLFVSGGGHAMAAGCSFSEDNLERVSAALNDYADRVLTPDDFIPTVRADLEVGSDELPLSVAESISLMEPFGIENPAPTFLARNVSVMSIRPTRNPEHVQLKLRQNEGLMLDGIGFNMGARFQNLPLPYRTDLIFQANVDEWKGIRSLKWNIKDFVPAAS